MKTGMRSVFWAALLCVGTLRPPVAQAAFPKVTAAHGSAAGAYFGAAVAVIEDSDADGQCDLLIGGFQGSCGVGSTCNEVYLYSALEGTRLQTFTDSGSEVPSLFGVHVASIGDVDDDDAPDVVVGAPTYATDDVNDVERGRVYVFSGDDGTEIYHIDGPRTYGWFGGAILAERDFNDDGIRDLVVSAHGKDGGSDKSVHLYDGEDGSLIWTVMNPSAEDGELFGFSLAVTDIDEDGTPELVVGAPFNGADPADEGHVYFYEVPSNEDPPTLVRTLEAPELRDLFGVSVAAAGDKVFVGAPYTGILGSGASGVVHIYDRDDGTHLGTWDAEMGWDKFGENMATGLPACMAASGADQGDVAVGAHDWTDPEEEVTNRGKAYLFSSVSGDLVYAWQGQQEDEKIGQVLHVADLDGDGRNDLLLGTPFFDGPTGEDSGKASLALGPIQSFFEIDVDLGPHGEETPLPVQTQVFGVNLSWPSTFNGFEAANEANENETRTQTYIADVRTRIIQNVGTLLDLGNPPTEPLRMSFRYPGGLLSNTFNWQKSIDHPDSVTDPDDDEVGVWLSRAQLNAVDVPAGCGGCGDPSPPACCAKLTPSEKTDVGEDWIAFGLNEFLCTIEKLVEFGVVAPGPDGYLPVTITLPGVSSVNLDDTDVLNLCDGCTADEIALGGVSLARLAGTLYEYVNGPDTDDFPWARKRICPDFSDLGEEEPSSPPSWANNVSHPEPFRVRYFEVGNETRKSGLEDEYTTRSLIPVALAMRTAQWRVQRGWDVWCADPEHEYACEETPPPVDLDIGAVSWDAYAANTTAWGLWNKGVWNTQNAHCWLNVVHGDLTDFSAGTACINAWSRHIYSPGYSGFGALAFRKLADSLSVSRTLAAGTYDLEYTLDQKKTATPQDQINAIMTLHVTGGGNNFTESSEPIEPSENADGSLLGYTRVAPTATINLSAPALITMDMTVTQGPPPTFDPAENNTFLYPLVLATRGGTTVPDVYFDFRKARDAHLVGSVGVLYWERLFGFVRDSAFFPLLGLDFHGLPNWITEHHPESLSYKPRVDAPDLQEALHLAVAYQWLLREGIPQEGIPQAHLWEAFNEYSFGLIEGIAGDVRENGRTVAREDPRMRPTALVHNLLLRSTLAETVQVQPDPPTGQTNPAFATGPNATYEACSGSTHVAEELLLLFGMGGFGAIDPDVNDACERTLSDYVQAMATAADDTVNVVLVNLDPDRPNQTTLRVADKQIAVAWKKTLAAIPAVGLAREEVLRANNEPEGEVDVDWNCQGKIAPFVRNRLPGFDPCAVDDDEQTRTVTLCSSSDLSGSCLRDGDVRITEETIGSASAATQTVTLPPASVVVVSLTTSQ